MRFVTMMLAAGALAAGTAHASATRCSDASGAYKFEETRYAGGPPPPPFLVTVQERWLTSASTLSNQYSDDAGWQREFTATFDDATRTQLASESIPEENTYRQTYAIHLSVRPESAAGNWDGYVICQFDREINPRP